MSRKLGVVVPYRDRHKHLEIFNAAIKAKLEEQNINYELIIVHQDNGKLFNRGTLLNIGYTYAVKAGCDYVVFHDIDMIPVDVDYSFSRTPIHLASGFVSEENNETFDEYFGGVTMFPVSTFKKINGYSNKYWGWGYEDTDLLFRCIKNDIDLNTKQIKNMGGFGMALKFNGYNSYIVGKNNFNLNDKITFFVSFYPESFICDNNKPIDEFNVFTIPGYDFAIQYNSFSRYNFCTFDSRNNVLFVNSKIKTDYKTNICVTIDNTEKQINVYQDGELIGSTETFNKLHSYLIQPNFYLGVSNPEDEKAPKFFKGTIDQFVVYDEVLKPEEIKEISTNKYRGLTQNFGDYESAPYIKLYYDAKFIKGYKLMDLSGKGNEGTIVNCEITEQYFNQYKEIQIPHRRNSLFKTLKHDSNGFVDNAWKHQATRWNQLRYYNEVIQNEELIQKDGLSDLVFVEHGILKEDKVTVINIGL